jgi:hypothetical protein
MGRSAKARMGAAAIAAAGTVGSAFHSSESPAQSPGLGFLVPGELQQAGAILRPELASRVAAPVRAVAGPNADHAGASLSAAAQRVGTLLFAAAVARRSKTARRAKKGEEPALESAMGVDYTELRNLLDSKDYKAADAETRRLLIVLAGDGAVKRGWVYFSEVKTIPEVDFMTLDGLWQHFSGGKFGFTPQRKAWRQVRGQFDKFAEQVSWFTGKWENRNWPDEFVYDDKAAPAGHLPLTNCIRGAQVLDELLNHPSFDKKKTTTKKGGGMSMLAFGASRQRESEPMAFAGASRSKVSLRGVSMRAGPEVAEPPAATASASLKSLEICDVVNEFGFVFPDVPDDTEASAFLVYDSQKKPMYLGFSKDLRNTLRTLLVRRPELCYHYKCVNLVKAGKEDLLAIRSAWLEELGGLPVGNKEARQKGLWESPVDGGGMSERAYRISADQKAKQVIQQLKDRGVKEPMIFSEELLDKGKVEVVPSKVEKEQLSAQQASLANQTTTVEMKIPTKDGDKDVSFEVFYAAEFQTNGGWWLDVEVCESKSKSSHRVIVGRAFMETVKATSPRQVLEGAFAVLIANKVPRKTEGIITSENFPVNYFTAANVAAWFPEFVTLFDSQAGKNFDVDCNQWSFKQVHDYSQDSKRTIPAGPNQVYKNN